MLNNIYPDKDIVTFKKGWLKNYVFFFSKKHSQKVDDPEFIPVSEAYTTREEVKANCERYGGTEIPNPDPNYQA